MKNIFYWLICFIVATVAITASKFCYLILLTLSFKEAPIWVLISYLVVFVCICMPLYYSYEKLFTNILKIIKDEKTQIPTEEKEKV